MALIYYTPGDHLSEVIHRAIEVFEEVYAESAGLLTESGVFLVEDDTGYPVFFLIKSDDQDHKVELVYLNETGGVYLNSKDMVDLNAAFAWVIENG